MAGDPFGASDSVAGFILLDMARLQAIQIDSLHVAALQRQVKEGT
jgi:hypothetical protein